MERAEAENAEVSGDENESENEEGIKFDGEGQQQQDGDEKGSEGSEEE